MQKVIKKLVLIMIICLPVMAFSQSPEGQNRGMRDYSSGKSLYESRCQFCHGIKGDGKGPGSDVLVPRPSDFTDPDFWKYRDHDSIVQTLMHGHGKGMPAFRFLPVDIEAVIDYLSHFNKSSGK